MKRLLLAVLSGVLLSCQGPAAVLAQAARPGMDAPGDAPAWSKERAELVRGTQTASTTCSMAPKMEWCLLSSISMRTVSPALRKGVSALPRRRVSTVRTSAMQE